MGVVIVVAPLMIILCLLPFAYYWYGYKVTRFLALKYDKKRVGILLYLAMAIMLPLSIYISWQNFLGLCTQPAYYHYEKITAGKPIFFKKSGGQSEYELARSLVKIELIKGLETNYKKTVTTTMI